MRNVAWRGSRGEGHVERVTRGRSCGEGHVERVTWGGSRGEGHAAPPIPTLRPHPSGWCSALGVDDACAIAEKGVGGTRERRLPWRVGLARGAGAWGWRVGLARVTADRAPRAPDHRAQQ